MSTELCPYCGNPLEEGTLRSRGGNFFLPKYESVPRLYSKRKMKEKKAIHLPPDFLALSPQWPHAYVCRNCQIMIIPYEE